MGTKFIKDDFFLKGTLYIVSLLQYTLHLRISWVHYQMRDEQVYDASSGNLQLPLNELKKQ